MMIFTCLVALVLAGAAPKGQIAFVSGTEQEDQCVCVLNLGTGSVTPVGTGLRDGGPVWSPDGEWLAFECQRPDGLGICVVRGDGSARRLLSHAQDWNVEPRWSTDGTKLAYSTGGGLDRKIVVYDLNTDEETVWGGDRSRLMRPVWLKPGVLEYMVRSSGEEVWAFDPETVLGAAALSGHTLMAIGLVGEDGAFSTDIFLVTQDGAAPLPTGALPSEGAYFEWAVEPNPRGGTMISELKYAGDLAFESNDGGDREIFVLSTRKGAFDLSNHRAADWNPVWSPDGKWLAFESFRSGRRGIYRAYPATIRVYPVAAATDSDNWHPAWSPDGQWLAFVSDRSGDPEIYVTDVAGKTVTRLTNHPGPDYAPAWRPEAHPE